MDSGFLVFMKRILRTIFPVVLLLTVLSGTALAQSKIATVDMKKLFENYWKTKQAQAALQGQYAQVVKDDNDMKDEFKKATEDYQNLLKQANDPAISDDERARRKQTAADKLKQLEQRRGIIDETERAAQTRLNDALQHMSEKIMAELEAAVNAKARAGGYAMVLNTSPETLNLGAAKVTVPSPVVYSVTDVDLTSDVLKQLNAGAPIDLSTLSNSAPAALPAPLLLNTNSP
jgi:outer membrane protein